MSCDKTTHHIPPESVYCHLKHFYLMGSCCALQHFILSLTVVLLPAYLKMNLEHFTRSDYLQILPNFKYLFSLLKRIWASAAQLSHGKRDRRILHYFTFVYSTFYCLVPLWHFSDHFARAVMYNLWTQSYMSNRNAWPQY